MPAGDGGPPDGRLIAGRYRLGARLGRGGMGTVWRAEDELLGRSVAVKELHATEFPATGSHVAGDAAGGDADAGRGATTLREARAVARVKHPHVVVVHDVVQEDGRPYIVMELVEGGSLSDRLRSGTLDVREAARITLALLGALRAAHGLGVLHRDLKPANVLLEEGTGRVVLTDFGIARLVGATTITDPGVFIGSPEYSAPERVLNAVSAGPASDLWSLGALLCAMLSGESPFRRDSLPGVLHAVVTGEIRPPAAAAPLLPLVQGLLEREPGDRLTAAEAERLLTAYVATGTPLAPLPPGRPSAGGPPPEQPTPQTPPPEDPPPGTAPPAASPPPDSLPPGPPPPDAPSPAAPSLGAQAPGAPSQETPSPGGPVPGASPSGVRASEVPAPSPSSYSRTQAVGRADVPTAGRAGPAAVPAPVEPARARRRGRTALLAGVLAAVLAGGGIAGLLLSRDAGDGRTDAIGSRSATADRTPATGGPVQGGPTAPVPAPESPGAPGASASDRTEPPVPAPDGFHTVHDPMGFTLAVPDGHVRSHDDKRVYYMSRDRSLRIGVRIQPLVPGGPVASMTQADENGPHTNPGFHDSSVTPTTHNGFRAALWEFTWDGFTVAEGRRHTMDLAWEENGLMYDVWVSAPLNKLDTARGQFDAALDSFTPPPEGTSVPDPVR
ncbi:protein kinase [Streptomyces sp. NPDC093085]|uniref:serine/threonine-protein kinase n=1 Tax=Streptomyces sp. NPDC093085 TaxID=3155068 RepID=UPI003448C9D3